MWASLEEGFYHVVTTHNIAIHLSRHRKLVSFRRYCLRPGDGERYADVIEYLQGAQNSPYD